MAPAKPVEKKQVEAEKPLDSLDKVVCINNQTLGVRTSDLSEVLFGVKRLERVNVFQGWGENKKYRRIHGTRYAFIKVQFPDIESGNEDRPNVGWVAESYIKPRKHCAGAEEAPQTQVSENKSQKNPEPQEQEESAPLS